MPNEGQWPGNFSHKMPLKYGGLFFEDDAVQIVLRDARHLEDLHTFFFLLYHLKTNFI